MLLSKHQLPKDQPRCTYIIAFEAVEYPFQISTPSDILKFEILAAFVA